MKEVSQSVVIADLGLVPYAKAWDYQKVVQKKLIDEKLRKRADPDVSVDAKDYLLFVEHPHVYTLGKSGDAANLLKNEEQLKHLNAEFVPIDRGGDITYHGPGQIVGYPIFDLDRYDTDLHVYLRNLEEAMILVLAEYGFKGERIDGLTGVWVNGAKICAMGIKCSRWVTMHGFAFNVNTDMSYFSHIVPCGITDKPVCSLAQLVGKPVEIEEVKTRISESLAKVFGFKIIEHCSSLRILEQ